MDNTSIDQMKFQARIEAAKIVFGSSSNNKIHKDQIPEVMKIGFDVAEQVYQFIVKDLPK